LNIKSKNFGKIYEYKISAKNPKMIKIPNYCAHGYLTLENNTTVIYFSDKAYQKKFEVAISYKDKDLNFKLKKKIKIASKKDKNGLSLKDFKSKI
jgi:dTDP-4-dehydrorhamnose 3,5-epimerase